MGKFILPYMSLSVQYWNSLFECELTLIVDLLSEVLSIIQNWPLSSNYHPRKFHHALRCIKIMIVMAGFCAFFGFDGQEDFLCLLVSHERDLFTESPNFVRQASLALSPFLRFKR